MSGKIAAIIDPMIAAATGLIVAGLSAWIIITKYFNFTKAIAAKDAENTAFKTEVNKIMSTQAADVIEFGGRLDALEKDVPLQIRQLKDFAVDAFTSNEEFKSEISAIKSLQSQRHKELREDTAEIKAVLTKMRTDKIKSLDDELIREKQARRNLEDEVSKLRSQK